MNETAKELKPDFPDFPQGFYYLMQRIDKLEDNLRQEFKESIKEIKDDINISVKELKSDLNISVKEIKSDLNTSIKELKSDLSKTKSWAVSSVIAILLAAAGIITAILRAG
ncbi:MAG: DUF1640 domain-containing protein [Peptococcaceae bacterium]|nr:MAG: DUF1640 domain-containing protein [Peptococcaceae bacterium]